MEVEIEGRTQAQAPMADGIEPGVHQFGVAGRWDATTIFGQEGGFGNDVEAGKQGESFIQDMTHDVTVTGIAEEFQRQQGAHGLAGRSSHCGFDPRQGKMVIGNGGQMILFVEGSQMNTKLLGAAVVGLLIGLVVPAIGWHQSAHGGQQDNAPRWEYKVETFAHNAAGATEQLSKLTDDGWEYVGVVNSAIASSGGRPGQPTLVAFKRPKK